MGKYLQKAILPEHYDNYVFDLYGTLVDIHTEEDHPELWEKLALFFGYYGAIYEPKDLQKRYAALVSDSERALKQTLEEDPHYAHEASPEIEITTVFQKLYQEKGVDADETLAVHTGQFFRALSTDYVRLYPGTAQMLIHLKKAGKKVYLLSNAQRIFTAYEMNVLDITKYFDDILISSDYQTKKPDERFFHKLLDRYDLDVSRSLYIGNDSCCDVGGAKQVNMPVFYINSNISPENDDGKEADYIVEHFTEWSYDTHGITKKEETI